MLSLSLSSAVRYKHSLARARASEPLKKIVARGKGDGAFQNFEITFTTKLFLSYYFSCDWRLKIKKMESGDEKTHTPSFLSVGFLRTSTKNQIKKTRTTNLPNKENELQPQS